MSTSALVIGDPHFKIANIRETDAMVAAISAVVAARRPNFIVVLGDTLDRHETIHVSPLTRAIRWLAELSRDIPVFLLIGNHDLKNNRQFLSEEHPFNALKVWGPTMTVVDTTKLAVINGHTYVFVPYVPPGRFVEALNAHPETAAAWPRARAIFAHQEFRGAKMGAIVSMDGDVWPLDHPPVISGHIHDYDELQPNVLYIGTPMQHAFGDRPDKTISMLSWDSEFGRHHERLALGLPQKHIIRINCEDVGTYVPPTQYELKIIIRGSGAELKAIMRHPNIDVWKKAGYRVIYKNISSGIGESEEEAPISHAPLRFSAVLYTAISDQPRLCDWYHRLFGAQST